LFENTWGVSSVFIVTLVSIVSSVFTVTIMVAVWVRVRRILFNLLSVFIVSSISRLGLRLLMIMVIVVHK
jgi:hypothetical protein